MTEVEKTGANPNEGTETVEDLKNRILELEKEKSGLVDEIKEDRQKRQAKDEEISQLQEAIKSATEKNTQTADPGDITTQVKDAVLEILNVDKEEKAKENKTKAFEKFVKEHKEFNEENDPTGKKREALQNKFNSFRHDGLIEINEFYSLIGDASKLLGVDTTPKTPVGEVQNPYSSTPSTATAPSIVDTKGISDLDKRLMEQNGWSEEKFLGLKEKNPTFVQSLYKYVQN